jgi:hypothetical protein
MMVRCEIKKGDTWVIIGIAEAYELPTALAPVCETGLAVSKVESRTLVEQSLGA